MSLNEEKATAINMLNSNLLPSSPNANFLESQYPSEIALHYKQNDRIDFNLNPVLLYQSLQFKRLPSSQVIVKKRKVCRCIVI